MRSHRRSNASLYRAIAHVPTGSARLGARANDRTGREGGRLSRGEHNERDSMRRILARARDAVVVGVGCVHIVI